MDVLHLDAWNSESSLVPDTRFRKLYLKHVSCHFTKETKIR